MSSQSKPSVPEEASIFTIMDDGDHVIEKLNPCCIMMVGLSRSGKSTSYNWILGKQMRGEGNPVTVYKNIANDNAATIAPGMRSVTLVPNIYKLSDKVVKVNQKGQVEVNQKGEEVIVKEGESIADMAGWKDKREYSKVIGVSYLLKATFQKCKNFKFLLVMSESYLTAESANDFNLSLASFVKMFHFRDMTPIIKKQFLNSIALLITKAEKKSTTHVGYLRQKRDQLDDPELNFSERKQMYELLDFIIQENKIQKFDIAKQNQGPSTCTILKDLKQHHNWDYFNLERANKTVGSNLINLPFGQQFQNLKESQKQKFVIALSDRLRCYKEFASILTNFIDKGIESWYTKGDQIDYANAFKKVNNFLNVNDKIYNTSTKLNLNKLNQNPKKAQYLNLVKEIINLAQLIKSIPDKKHFTSTKAYYGALKQFFKKIIDILRQNFCSTKDQDILICRVAYILERGFREFSMLDQISPYHVSSAPHDIKDSLEAVMLIKPSEIPQKFLKGLSLDRKKAIFASVEDVLKLNKFLQQYQKTQNNPFILNIISEHIFDIKWIIAGISERNNNYNQALRNYLACLKELTEYGKNYNESSQNAKVHEQQIEKQLDKTYMKMRRMLTGIKDCLLKINQKAFALSICKYMTNFTSTCQVYELIVADVAMLEKNRKKIFHDYAEYLISFGMIQQAKKQYHRLLDLEKDSFDEYLEVDKKLMDLLNLDKQRIVMLEKENIKQISIRLTGEEEELKDIISQIYSEVFSEDTPS